MKTIARMTVMAVLIIVGFTALFAEANPQLTGASWLAVTLISKAIGTACLLACGALGRRWYGWNMIELN